MQLRDVVSRLEHLAPPELAESWDNTGLLLGDLESPVQRVLTCLTITPDVVDEALREHSDLIVSHHPILFRPVQKLTMQTADGRVLWPLVRAGIAVYSPHTCWDNAPLGINQQLAELLDLQDVESLRPQKSPTQYKLITSVPTTDLERVQRVLWSAGCGVIGDYEQCSFYSPGSGTFRGNLHSDPTIGSPGQLEHVAELKLEVVCPASRLATAVAELRTAHSYEEPAIDVIPLESLPGPHGSGRKGRLLSPLTLRELVELVQQRLDCPGLQFVGDPQTSIQSVGVACGAAAEYWKDARQAGCQVLLTGEARFHAALEVRDAGFAMIVAGHDATERFAMHRLASLLMQHCPGVTAAASASERDPLQSP